MAGQGGATLCGGRGGGQGIEGEMIASGRSGETTKPATSRRWFGSVFHSCCVMNMGGNATMGVHNSPASRGVNAGKRRLFNVIAEQRSFVFNMCAGLLNNSANARKNDLC
jgi:hypothetical protein